MDEELQFLNKGCLYQMVFYKIRSKHILIKALFKKLMYFHMMLQIETPAQGLGSNITGLTSTELLTFNKNKIWPRMETFMLLYNLRPQIKYKTIGK